MSTIILKSGDLRPWTADFLRASFPNKVNIIDTAFVHKCEENEERKRKRIALFDKVDETVKQIQEKRDVIHIMGVMNITKSCRDNEKTMDKHRHWCPIIYNPFTNRVHLYIPWMYHQDSPKSFSAGVMMSTFLNRLKEQFATAGMKLEGATAPKISKTLIKKVQKWGKSKLDYDMNARIWYPLLVLAEMEEMIKNPHLSRKEIVNNLKNVPDDTFESLQNRLESFYAKHVFNMHNGERVCDNKIFHPETGRCVNKTGPIGKKIMDVKECNQNQVYNISTRRCNKRPHGKFMPMNSITVNSEEKTFLDNALGKQPLVTYLNKKYKHASVYPLTIEWHFDVKKETGKLKIPSSFDKFWTKNLKDDKKQQIVILASLSTSAFDILHANAIIFTKKTQELEVFEPNGLQNTPAFGGDQFYSQLNNYFDKFEFVRKLRTPVHYCPKKLHVFQSLETDEKGLWVSEGYCAAWSVWYTEHRLMNPLLTTKQCTKVAMDHLVDLGSLRAYIWNYDRWMRREVGN